MKRWCSFFLAAMFIFTCAGCGATITNGHLELSSPETSDTPLPILPEDDETDNMQDDTVYSKDRWYALRTTRDDMDLTIHLGQITPNVNAEPEAEAATTVGAIRSMTDAWVNSLPNLVTVSFTNAAKGDSYREWLSVAYSSGNGPDILCAWGEQDAGTESWYLPLDEALASPNYYEPGTPNWQEMFSSYLWEEGTNGIYDINGEIVGLPMLVSPGPMVAYFYNIELFDSMRWQPKSDWDDFIYMANDIRDVEHHTSISPSIYSMRPGFSNMSAQYSILPAYSPLWISDTDLNQDGAVSADEELRAVWSGYYYMENNPSLIEAYSCMAELFIDCYDKDYAESDYEDLWISGDVAMLERPVTEAAAILNTELDFTVGMFPLPVKVSEFTEEVAYTESAPYQPAPTLVPNVVRPSLQGKSAYYADYCIDLLKFMTTTENMNKLVKELNGTAVSAVRTCMVPDVLANWYTQSFPILPNVIRPARPTRMAENDGVYQNYLQMLVDGSITLEEFIFLHDELMDKDLTEYIEQNGIDTSDFGERYVLTGELPEPEETEESEEDSEE